MGRYARSIILRYSSLSNREYRPSTDSVVRYRSSLSLKERFLWSTCPPIPLLTRAVITPTPDNIPKYIPSWAIGRCSVSASIIACSNRTNISGITASANAWIAMTAGSRGSRANIFFYYKTIGGFAYGFKQFAYLHFHCTHPPGSALGAIKSRLCLV